MNRPDPMQELFRRLLDAMRRLDTASRSNLLRCALLDLRADLAGLPRGVGPSLSLLLAMQRAAQDVTVPLPEQEPATTDELGDDEPANTTASA